MANREVAPNDVGKNPAVIKMAQQDLGRMDVLVCGNCWTVCYFVEEFILHKQKPCKRETITNERDTKDSRPKIWAFLLWKARKLHNAKEHSLPPPGSWSLYQNWVKLDENVRETWVVAGRTIQTFTDGSRADLKQLPVRITKTVVNHSDGRKLIPQKPGVTTIKTEDSGSLPKTTPTSRPNKPPVAAVVGKQISALNKQNSRRAKRTPTAAEDTSEILEETVEKIVAKRLNANRKVSEYLIKWDSRSPSENTWEPLSHMDSCPNLVETFERQLAHQKETRARGPNRPNVVRKSNANAQKEMEMSKLNNNDEKNIEISPTTSNERPQRSSKTRAMDQVKQWMSGSPTRSTSPHSAEFFPQIDHTRVAVKRELPDENSLVNRNSDHLSCTTSTMEDLEDNLIPTHTVKRLRNGEALSVEVRTLNNNRSKPKVLKLSGTNTVINGELMASGPNTADVIVTPNKVNADIILKPQPVGVAQPKKSVVRILTKSESAVSHSGIVLLPGGAEVKLAQQNNTNVAQPTVNRSTISPRTAGTSITTTHARNTAASTTRTASPTIRQLAGGSTIQRKIVTNNTDESATRQRRVRTMSTTTIQPTVAKSRAPVQRAANTTLGRPSNTVIGKSNVSPEQKILQLSKSGDLKVTKKLMTQEDVQQQRQMRQQHQTSSQVQIQKVQQFSSAGNARNGSNVNVSPGVTAVLKMESYSPPHDESILCPVTGKLLGPAGEAQEQQEQLQKEQAAAEVLQAAQMMEELQQQQQQQQQQVTQQNLNVLLQQQQQQEVDQQELQQLQQQQLQDIDATTMLLTSNDPHMLTNEDGTPVLVTGEDGTVYQVAGKNAEGQTILVTQGPDGEQHFAYVATAESDENAIMSMNTAMADAVAEAVAQLPSEQQAYGVSDGQYLLKTTQDDGTTHVIAMTQAEFEQHQALLQRQQQQQQIQQAMQPGASTVTVNANDGQLCIQSTDADGTETSIPAEIVQADLPSPDGMRRLVLLLQDGTFMVTEMHESELKGFNIEN